LPNYEGESCPRFSRCVGRIPYQGEMGRPFGRRIFRASSNAGRRGIPEAETVFGRARSPLRCGRRKTGTPSTKSAASWADPRRCIAGRTSSPGWVSVSGVRGTFRSASGRMVVGADEGSQTCRFQNVRSRPAPGRVHGRASRRSWSAAEKGAIVAESYGAGETVCGVARRHRLTPQQPFTW
jgi:hypothetical protein